MHSKLLTVRDVGRLAELGPKGVRNAIKRGELRARKIGGEWRITEDEYEAWIERGARHAAAEVVEVVPVPPVCGSLEALRRIESEAA